MTEDTQRPAGQGQQPKAHPELIKHADALRADPATPGQAPDDRLGEQRARVHSEEAPSFSRHVHEYIREYIRLADQKAIFVFAFASALLGFLYQKKAHANWYRPLDEWGALSPVALVAMISLAIGVGLAIWVIVPRLGKTHRGNVFFRSIQEYESASDYARTIAADSDDQLTDAILKHCFDLSRTCDRKYVILKVSIVFVAIGIFCSLFVLLGT